MQTVIKDVYNSVEVDLNEMIKDKVPYLVHEIVVPEPIIEGTDFITGKPFILDKDGNKIDMEGRTRIRTIDDDYKINVTFYLNDEDVRKYIKSKNV